MTYNLSNELDRKRFQAKVEAFAKRGALVELCEKVTRTRAQNSYLHKLIGIVAMETGNTIDYCKEVYFKRIANASVFVKDKEDPIAGKVTFVRSSTDLTKEEMSDAIERFKRWGAENGFYLPSPGDESLLAEIEAEMEKMKKYL